MPVEGGAGRIRMETGTPLMEADTLGFYRALNRGLKSHLHLPSRRRLNANAAVCGTCSGGVKIHERLILTMNVRVSYQSDSKRFVKFRLWQNCNTFS